MIVETVQITSVWVGAIAAVLTPLVYGLGNRWWSNYWGRTLMFKDVMIALAYARSVINLVTSRFLSNASWSTVAISFAIATALTANLVVMTVVTWRARRTEKSSI